MADDEPSYKELATGLDRLAKENAALKAKLRAASAPVPRKKPLQARSPTAMDTFSRSYDGR